MFSSTQRVNPMLSFFFGKARTVNKLKRIAANQSLITEKSVKKIIEVLHPGLTLDQENGTFYVKDSETEYPYFDLGTGSLENIVKLLAAKQDEHEIYIKRLNPKRIKIKRQVTTQKLQQLQQT